MRSPSPAAAAPSTRWVVPIAIAGYILVLGATTLKVFGETAGHLVYALDDPYIHMAIARNVAQNATWGVHAGTFAAASSSPLWTLTLSAAFLVIGVREWIPLLLNIVFSLAVILRLATLLRRAQLPYEWQLVVLLGTLLFTPLAVLTWLGMEHTLFVWLTLETAWTTAALVDARPNGSATPLAALALLLVATRYEGLFVVAGCAVSLVLVRLVREAAIMSAAACVPAMAAGVWQLSHGWYFLPTSVLMKQTVLAPSGRTLLLDAVVRNVLNGAVPLVVIALIAAALWCVVSGLRQSGNAAVDPLLTTFLAAAALHLLLAKFGHLYRYEAYLIALGVSAVACALARAAMRDRKRRETPLFILATFLLVVLIFGSRTIESHGRTAVTAGHIYRQQRQMATFLSRYYDDATVALNDIGAAAFYSNSRIDDLMGLSSLDAAEARRSRRFDAAWINGWLERDAATLAIIFEPWFPPPIDFQSQWIRVARWDTDSGDQTEGIVSFYARDRESAARVAAQLREFSQQLPPGTVQTFD